MANNRIALEEAWCNLIAQENQYYKSAAKYLLCKEGINHPTVNQLRSKINYLLHIHLSLSLHYGKRLSESEIRSLFYASCGEELKESAVSINRTPDVIKRHRMSALKKLQSESMPQAMYRAIQLGYLPFSEKIPLEKLLEPEEAENAFV